eukprot:14615877-Ditylum_brightwellii.AAC.1
MGLLDLELTEQSQCNQSFPVAVTLDDHGHGTQGISSHMGQPHIGNGEDIYLTSKDAHHLNNNHNTTLKKHFKGSTNGNVLSENISSYGRESLHIAKEENLTDFMRDHPPPIQVILQRGGYRSCFV